MSPPAPRLRDLLAHTFGVRQLRPGQRTVIDRVLAGRSTLAVMPTGAGKSLCYQAPALMLAARGRTLVVSPLIALMKDQCDHLRDLGLQALALHSALPAAERHATEAALDEGGGDIVFLTPEQLAEPATRKRLLRRPCALLAVDEAHCLSQWGHDFRPAFLDIPTALPALGHPTVLALTATAQANVLADLTSRLGIAPDGVVNTGQYRPNLGLAVHAVSRAEDKLARAVELLADERGPAIVYTATIQAAEQVAQALQAQAALLGEPGNVGLYHGRLAARQRHAVQDAFMAGTVRTLVATNAFGLGIDKPDIRLVLHHQLPPNLDAYYQEAGRAGRDGEPARCHLLYLQQDRAVQQFFLANRYPAQADVEQLYRLLHEPPPEGTAWTRDMLQAALDRPANKLHVALALLRAQRIVHQRVDGTLHLRRTGLDAAALAALAQAYQARRSEDRAMLEEMVAYAQGGTCRWRVLLAHFDALPEDFDRCGHCDNCQRMDALLQQAEAASPGDAPPAAEHAAFAPGQAVRVRRYGRGVVTEASTQMVAVRFANGEERRFLPPYVMAA